MRGFIIAHPGMRTTAVLFVAWVMTVLPNLGQGAAKSYRVEMVLFRNTGIDTGQGEQWRDELIVPNVSGAVELTGGSPPAGFTVLPTHAGSLLQAATLLERSSRYQVLEHLIWEQPAMSENSAIPIHIQGGKRFETIYPPPDSRLPSQFMATSPEGISELDGTVKVFLGRFLHVHTDLVYRRSISQRGEPDQGESSFPQNRLIQTKVIHQRKMRSGELHYLDHPLLGILVKITPVES